MKYEIDGIEGQKYSIPKFFARKFVIVFCNVSTWCEW
jgi:hypothetical protein